MVWPPAGPEPGAFPALKPPELPALDELGELGERGVFAGLEAGLAEPAFVPAEPADDPRAARCDVRGAVTERVVECAVPARPTVSTPAAATLAAVAAVVMVRTLA